MPALPFVHELFGWKKGVPNMADSSSKNSVAIAGALLAVLGITHTVDHAGQTAGKLLEQAVEDHLAAKMPGRFAGLPVIVDRRAPITDFAQYRHLATLRALIEGDETHTLRASIGTDYVIKPDVTVGLEIDPEKPLFLHAAVPCKWTLRSDRAQNIRHEAVVLIRHRRARLPHIAPVTAEPQPSRLASLARGTAEVDAVYHVALDELQSACGTVGNAKQSEILEELVSHDRLRDLSALVPTLSM